MMKKISILLALGYVLGFQGCNDPEGKSLVKHKAENKEGNKTDTVATEVSTSIYVDTLAYNEKLKYLSNGDTVHWPIKDKSYPLKGAILPFNRIVAYYGNLYSRQMGVLGEYTPKIVWEKLNAEIALWKKADSATPVIPAIHYIAVVAQAGEMRDKSYCMRMPNSQIDSVLSIAKMGNAIVFLDVQLGHSSVEKEIPRLEKYLKLPNVHLGLDPEFAMKDGDKPGRRMGKVDAAEINFCTEYLADLVKKHNLTPKIFIVHRFTQPMVKNYKNIVLRPEVQIVMDMDGWGGAVLKLDTYKRYIYREPVQFTGFKLFYKNDLLIKPFKMLLPEEIVKLKPAPIYIQYQ